MHLRTCPNCGESAGPTDYTCPNCGWDGYTTAKERREAEPYEGERDEWTDFPVYGATMDLASRPATTVLTVRHPPGHPLAGALTMAFLAAAIELAFGNLTSTGPDLVDARALAAVPGLLWG